MIDEEIKEIIDKCYKETKEMLIEKRELLDKMADALLKKEVLDKEEIKNLLS
jgi:cell division protease FtsH